MLQDVIRTDDRVAVTNEGIMAVICDLAEIVARRGAQRLAQGLLLAVTLQTELNGCDGSAIPSDAFPRAERADMDALALQPDLALRERLSALEEMRLKVEEVELHVRLRKARDEMKRFRESDLAKKVPG